MKILFYLGLDRTGQKQQEVIDIPDYEVNEWITFGLTHGYKVDENLPIQTQVQKIVDKSYEEMYNADRKEFYHTVGEMLTEDDEGNILSNIDLLEDESPNQLEQMIEAEDDEVKKQVYKVFMNSITETQKRRITLRMQGLSYKEIAEKEGVSIRSIRDTLESLKIKYEEILKNI